MHIPERGECIVESCHQAMTNRDTEIKKCKNKITPVAKRGMYPLNKGINKTNELMNK